MRLLLLNLHLCFKAELCAIIVVLDFISIFSGLPLIPCLLYMILRMIHHLDNEMCWALPASESYIEWIYMAPGFSCILANFIFFINIFRILVTKLRAPHANEPAHFR